MPNRRRTARKLKRSINKAKLKVKRAPDATTGHSSGTGKKQDDKNLNENMMLKLMALFGNK